MKKGFTWIELLVGVLIIGILSAGALPQYRKAVFRSQLVEAGAILNNYKNAMALYLLENGGYPEEQVLFTGEQDSGALSTQVSYTGKNSVTYCNGKFSWYAKCSDWICTLQVGTGLAKGSSCNSGNTSKYWTIEIETSNLGKNWRSANQSYVFYNEEEWKKPILCQWGREMGFEVWRFCN